MSKKVIILGASDNVERYSNKALKMLTEKGHLAIPVHPKLDYIESIKVYSSLKEIDDDQIDTLTIYVNPQISSSMQAEIIDLNPKRVIFNPGSENPELQSKLNEKGIETLEACTLVMLSTEQF